MGSQLSEYGLCLTQHGEIEGTPTKSGNCHINILVVSEGGGENSVSFDLTVNTATTENTQDTTDMDTPDSQDSEQDFPWWGYVIIAFGGIGVGIGMTLVFVKVKKKA